MVQQILFLCPHNAAKSVLATAYFNKRAGEVGLEARAVSAGTDPDEQVAPHVAVLLAEEGYDGAGHKPSRVTRADLEKADRIVSIGCALSDLSQTEQADKNVTQWEDVPPPSRDLAGAWRQIKERVDELIGQL